MTRPALFALLLVLVWPGGAHAASCSFVPSGNTLVGFGSYSGLGGDVDGIGNITIACIPDLPLALAVTYTIAANAGSGSGGSFNPRRLAAGAYALDYNMYLDPARTQVFGDGTAGTRKAAGACSASCLLTVYGRIFGRQSVPGGNYQDQLLITLEF